MIPDRKRTGVLAIALVLATSIVAPAPSATAAECVPNEVDGSCLPVRPESERVDRFTPTFTNPTDVTNPLFPVSRQRSMVFGGSVDGEAFRSEVTLLPQTRTLRVFGQSVRTLVSQYVAYLDGRLAEVALDYYAQADDGSVWYFGEDVFNYEEGVVADHHGTWLAGRDGPAAMIMPAHPRVGDVYRPENIPGNVFEEVVVQAVDVTVDGPTGPVSGAIAVQELHQDGAYEDKTFAPGYGEHSNNAGEEVLALGIPTDALPGAVPAALRTIAEAADSIFDDAGRRNWAEATRRVRTIQQTWQSFSTNQIPPVLRSAIESAIDDVVGAVAHKRSTASRAAAIAVLQATFDVQLRHRPVAGVDLARLDLVARRVLVDAPAHDTAGVSGDAAVAAVVRDRVAHTLAAPDKRCIDRALRDLRTAADQEDMTAARRAAERLRRAVADAQESSGFGKGCLLGL